MRVKHTYTEARTHINIHTYTRRKRGRERKREKKKEREKDIKRQRGEEKKRETERKNEAKKRETDKKRGRDTYRVTVIDNKDIKPRPAKKLSMSLVSCSRLCELAFAGTPHSEANTNISFSDTKGVERDLACRES